MALAIACFAIGGVYIWRNGGDLPTAGTAAPATVPSLAVRAAADTRDRADATRRREGRRHDGGVRAVHDPRWGPRRDRVARPHGRLQQRASARGRRADAHPDRRPLRLHLPAGEVPDAQGWR